MHLQSESLSTLMFAVARCRNRKFVARSSRRFVSRGCTPEKAGGTVKLTTVDHALVRGLVTAGPDASQSVLCLNSSVGI